MKITLEHFKDYVIKHHSHYSERTGSLKSKQWSYKTELSSVQYIENSEEVIEHYSTINVTTAKYIFIFDDVNAWKKGDLTFEMPDLDHTDNIDWFLSSLEESEMMGCIHFVRSFLAETQAAILEKELQKNTEAKINQIKI